MEIHLSASGRETTKGAEAGDYPIVPVFLTLHDEAAPEEIAWLQRKILYSIDDPIQNDYQVYLHRVAANCQWRTHRRIASVWRSRGAMLGPRRCLLRLVLALVALPRAFLLFLQLFSFCHVFLLHLLKKLASYLYIKKRQDALVTDRVETLYSVD